MLIHVVTQKGKGYAPAESATDKYHGVTKFDVITGTQQKAKSNAPCYTSVFAKQLVREAATDDRIVAINAAMPAGTGLDLFAKAYPERCFDVGIAEQHAVTFAAGLATEGFRPFCAIYSTFLQRAYDQVVHDVAIQGLPVRFAIDRAGLVGADGATHAGSFDVAYLGCLPGFVIMAAADELELMRMVATAARHDSGPIAFRYPRGEGVGMDMPETIEPLEIGKGRVVREGSKVAILSFGARLQEALKAADDAGRARHLDHGGRRPLRQAARPRADRSAGRQASADPHHRGGLDRRLRQPRPAAHARCRPARFRQAAAAQHDPARPVRRARHARRPVPGRGPRRGRHHGPGGQGAGRAAAGQGSGPRRSRVSPAVPAVFTIGYQESNPEAVIGTLAAAGVALLVDVRAVAASRRPGFSKRQLAAGVATAGIDYLHLRGLGTPPDGRLAARTGRYAEMRRIFEAHMAAPDRPRPRWTSSPAWSRPGGPCACSASSGTPTIATVASWASGSRSGWGSRWSIWYLESQRQNGTLLSRRASSRLIPISRRR